MKDTTDELAARPVVRQRSEHDCFLCCLAMMLGTTYEDVVGRLDPETVARVQSKGANDEDMKALPARLGLDLRMALVWTIAAGRDEETRARNAKAVRNLLWGRRAIVQVNSKNYPGDGHLIYWDGHDLHDPSTKLRFTWDDVWPVYVWMLDERARIDALSAEVARLRTALAEARENAALVANPPGVNPAWPDIQAYRVARADAAAAIRLMPLPAEAT